MDVRLFRRASRRRSLILSKRELVFLFITQPKNTSADRRYLTTSMDANFRWFEGEKAQYRFVPYGWAFLFVGHALRVFRQPLLQRCCRTSGSTVLNPCS